MCDSDRESLSARPARYARYRYTLAVIDTVYLLAILFAFVGLGLSKLLSGKISRLIAGYGLFTLPAYLLTVYLIYLILDLPLGFYRSFVLEHKFSLSNQKIGSWFLDRIKSAILSYIIGLVILSAFYAILNYYPAGWWLAAALFWVFFSLILAKLLPIAIIPLFFKYKKLSDEMLKQRIMHLADKMKIGILDCFEIDFSKKTLKANAAYVGWGKSRWVILADTLKDKYTYDEIEVILAHEFAHYKLKHLLKLILVNALATLAIFYFIFKTNVPVLNFFGFSSLADIAALPVLFIYFVLSTIVLQPWEYYISRKLERNADLMALKAAGSKEAFISMMEKLGFQNLADRKPHPIIKIFFFDHPPIDERINLANSLYKIKTGS